MCMRSLYDVAALTLCVFCRPFKVVPGKDNKPMIEGVPCTHYMSIANFACQIMSHMTVMNSFLHLHMLGVFGLLHCLFLILPCQ